MQLVIIMTSINRQQNCSSFALQCWVCMDLKFCSMIEKECKPEANCNFNKSEQLISKKIEKLTLMRPNLATIFEKVQDADEENLTRFPKIPNIACRNCKMQHYCSLNHLNKDRNQHRDICKILTDLRKLSEVSHPLLILNQEGIFSFQQLLRAIGLLKFVARFKLRRPLTRREHDLIGYPAYCQICFKLQKLRTCGECGAVAYCSEEHGHLDKKKHTPEVCSTLALLYSPYRCSTNENIKIPDISIDIMPDQLQLRLEESHLIEIITKITGLVVNESPCRTIQDFEKFNICSSFSGIASLCLALKQVSFKAQPQNICTVYIVGATNRQIQRYFREMHLKFFFLLYTDICQLDLYFIGNRLKIQEKNNSSETLTFEFLGQKRTIIKYFYPITFKQFACIHRIDPVLIIMLDVDLHGLYNIGEQIIEEMNNIALQANSEINTDNWSKCLTEILCIYGVPICFTSLTKALSQSNYTAILEVAKQSKIEVKRCYRGDMNENPYREILPERNQHPEISEMVIYANNYMEVIFTLPKQ